MRGSRGVQGLSFLWKRHASEISGKGGTGGGLVDAIERYSDVVKRGFSYGVLRSAGVKGERGFVLSNNAFRLVHEPSENGIWKRWNTMMKRMFSSDIPPRRGWEKFYPKGKGRRPVAQGKKTGMQGGFCLSHCCCVSWCVIAILIKYFCVLIYPYIYIYMDRSVQMLMTLNIDAVQKRVQKQIRQQMPALKVQHEEVCNNLYHCLECHYWLQHSLVQIEKWHKRCHSNGSRRICFPKVLWNGWRCPINSW